ncbi:hypothetical protein BCV71DRAFT_284197 [Rhizopus microsporus]|uniref:Uncharacterized protein n=1 Tax=Rhizopus microsporus TaxID=58291 RepID=A0A1X0SEP8_RHIZD|nr:hypothetical protein BCV71DRAFT_284197 [Rhizopus microsporus]
MTRPERNCCICWHLGWLSDNHYKACLHHPHHSVTKTDSLPFILNILSIKRPPSR